MTDLLWRFELGRKLLGLLGLAKIEYYVYDEKLEKFVPATKERYKVEDARMRIWRNYE